LTPAAIAGAALALSLAGNAALTWAYLGQRDAAATARQALQDMEGQRDGALVAADACSASVAAAASAAADASRRAQRAQAAAAEAGRQLRQRADATLSAGPAIPGDDCASARVTVDAWLLERSR
jgi:hypothetical protein